MGNSVNNFHGLGIISEVRSILLSEWDPIGVGDNLNLSDEYDRYINVILRLLTKDATIEDIANTLIKIEQTEMGLITSNSITSSYNAARILKKISQNMPCPKIGLH